jgi:hypothetical protein
MKKQVRAKIYWLSPEEGGRSSLPIGLRYVTVATFADGPELPPILWSLVVEASVSFKQNEWNRVVVSFLNPENAPHHLLKQGQRFQLYEGKRLVATGEITNSLEAALSLHGGLPTIHEQVVAHSPT